MDSPAFKPGSVYNSPSRFQREAIEALTLGSSGTIDLPCGAGKTLIILNLALKAKKFLCISYEATGAKQIYLALKTHTTIAENEIGVTGNQSVISDESNYISTTYAMGTTNSKLAQKIFHENTYDVICLDECHHAPSVKYYQFLSDLINRSKCRVIGFTGTLFRPFQRETACPLPQGVGIFDFIGPNLYTANCKQLENEGLIAKVQLMSIDVPLTGIFKSAFDVCAEKLSNNSGLQKKYLAATHPDKMAALTEIVRIHSLCGHKSQLSCKYIQSCTQNCDGVPQSVVVQHASQRRKP